MENSIKLYGEILERPALCVLDVEESFAWGDDLIDTQFKPAANSIFLIDLQMDQQKAYYTTNPDKFVVGAFPFYRSNDIAFHSIKLEEIKTKTNIYIFVLSSVSWLKWYTITVLLLLTDYYRLYIDISMSKQTDFIRYISLYVREANLKVCHLVYPV